MTICDNCHRPCASVEPRTAEVNTKDQANVHDTVHFDLCAHCYGQMRDAVLETARDYKQQFTPLA